MDNDEAQAGDNQSPPDNQTGQATQPGNDDSLVGGLNNPVVSPAGGFPRPTTDQVNDAKIDEAAEEKSDQPVKTPGHHQEISGDLLEIRRKALSELQPIIDQLDLPADEKFKTLMMMIQSTDNQTLLDAAYRAAHDIKNDKERAEALLDIINEINYFTQHPND